MILLNAGMVLFGAFYLFLVLRGLLTKRPFVLSILWGFAPLLPMYFSMVLIAYRILTEPSHLDWPFIIFFSVFCPLMLFFPIFFKDYYVAYGVDEDSFRQALLKALQKLKIGYKESFSHLQLDKNLGALKSRGFMFGQMNFTLVGGRSKGTLRRIAQELDRQLAVSKTGFNRKSVWMGLVMAGLMLCIAFMNFFALRFLPPLP